MGSPKYMAPEQIQGGHVDERTDIYSLGIIMYEMLAGKVPFERATSVNILMAHVGEPPPPMRAVNPNLVCSPAFEDIVMSCIAKDPKARISSMDALLQAIRLAHGGSLTGQIQAVNISGQYTPPGAPFTPPPTMITGATGAMAAASGSPSMGLVRAEASNDIGSGPLFAPPRSKLWILAGVVAAAVIGGGLGMLAFQWTSPEPTTVLPPSPSSASSPTLASGTSLPAVESSTPATESKPASLAVTTDPPGASVREDGRELCAATPCDVVFNANPSKTHKLVIARAGFKTETRIVKVSDPPVHVRLVHATGSGRPSPKPESKTPSGFKDQPY